MVECRTDNSDVPGSNPGSSTNRLPPFLGYGSRRSPWSVQRAPAKILALLAQLARALACQARGYEFKSRMGLHGGIAHVGRAGALQAQGRRFDSGYLHHGVIVQLVERWSPKPNVLGSIPGRPAN